MIGGVDDLKICMPQYLGTAAGNGRSMATIRSRMVFQSSAIDSLHSTIAASRWDSV